MTDQRDEFVRLLSELGASGAELDGDENELSRRAWRRIFGVHGESVPMERVTEQARLDPSLADRIMRATGLREPLTADDVPLFHTFRIMADLVGEEQALHLARVAGAAMARVADAGAAAMRVNWEAPLVTETSYADYLTASVDVIGDLFPRLGVLFERLFRHLVVRISEQGYSLTPGGAATTRRLVVGFADVVGFTAHAAATSAEDLVRVIDDFEASVSDAIARNGGRVVKFIGDEVMFAFEDADAACACAADLVDLSAADEIPEVRVGISLGDVLMRFGDLYGPVVNLAARLVAAAPPNTVLVTADLAAAASSHSFTAEEPRVVKGIDDPIANARLIG